MAKYKEIVYMVLDEIRAISDDSTITEEHVLFLMKQYRAVLLQQKILKEGSNSLLQSNQQEVCLTLEKTQAIPGLDYCNDIYLKSKEEIPALIEGAETYVYPVDQFSAYFKFVDKNRFKYVGYNKYMANIIYVTLGIDNHLYFKGLNPQFSYLNSAKLVGVFEDNEKASELQCIKDDETCDIMDKDFPLQSDLIPQLIQQIVQELLAAEYRPEDNNNNAKDDLSDLASFVRQNMKSNLAKQITE